MGTAFRREHIRKMGLGKEQDILEPVGIDILFFLSSLVGGRCAVFTVCAMDFQKLIVVSGNRIPSRTHDMNYLPYRRLNIGVRSFLV